MEDFKDLARRRRSHRRFTDAPVSRKDLQLILQSALMSPTARGQRSWQFAVVNRKEDLALLATAKDSGGRFLANAPLAIVVMGSPEDNDCWVEDCSIAAISMQYQAEDLGLGSCWIQMRGRGQSGGTSANEAIHAILGLPGHLEVLCVLAIGHASDERPTQDEEGLRWENVIVKSDD